MTKYLFEVWSARPVELQADLQEISDKLNITLAIAELNPVDLIIPPPKYKAGALHTFHITTGELEEQAMLGFSDALAGVNSVSSKTRYELVETPITPGSRGRVITE